MVGTMRYAFEQPLAKGLIRNRPNRFVMVVESGGRLLRCRCPSPTKIGKVRFKSTPCLLSVNKTQGTTTHTVEAIRLKMATGANCWVGINQTRVNAMCKHFMEKGALHKMLKGEVFSVGRKIHKSVIDFASENSLLEIKAPLTVLPSLSSGIVNYSHGGDYERTVRHCRILCRHARAGKRSVFLLAYQYPAPRFNPIKQNAGNKVFLRALQQAYVSGVEFWQINFSFSATGVKLLKYSRLHFAV